MRAKWILIGATIVVCGAGLYWLNAARTYDELDFGAISAPPQGARIVEDEYEDTETAVVPLRSGRRMRYAVSVLNRGGRTVTITGIGKADPDRKWRDYRLTPIRVQMSPHDGLMYDDLVPFRPVELEPNEQRTFVIDERMPSCRHYSEGGGTGVGWFDVRFKTLVFNRELSIPMRQPIDVIKGAGCRKA
jgi:hypothetical protein